MAAYGRFFGNPINLLCLRTSLINCNQPTAYMSKSSTLTVDLPPKPKKPASPYINFVNQIRPQLQQEMPGIKSIEVLRAACKRWAEVDPSEKSILKEEFHKKLVQYKEDINKYMDSLTPEQLKQLKAVKKETEAKAKKKYQRKMQKELGMPKRPPSSFILYMLEQREKYNNDVFKDMIKKISESWKLLPEIEKEKYSILARQEFDKYRAAMEKWQSEQRSKSAE